MKQIRSNGTVFEVRDVGPVIFRLEAERGIPLPLHDDIIEDNAARAMLRGLLATGRYKGGKVG